MSKTNAEMASEVLVQAKASALEFLSDSDHAILSISIGAGMDKLINQINFATGNASVSTTITDQFPPVTEVMGEKVNKPTEVVKEELTPQEARKKEFLEKVDNLQKNFPALESTKILENYVTKDDLQAIRGVAKRAGLTDFKTATLDHAYLELIRVGLQEVAKAAAEKKETEETIASESKDK